ncbi:chromate transporter [Terrihabitans soli]|uniref:Chromate transporter n=1 Tax=Terrihabitans soli TaxID=708113 RepID=A0A6S6QQ66_9HYPH|nr:chromate transporter [Terrihabitans soli]BCJ91179.1 chromate transporter [Terrihabitans soli]
MNSDLGKLIAMFAPLSLISIGGINSTFPEMHRLAVEVHQWMSDEEFVRLYAISQAAPGPNLMVVTLIGWHVAGMLGGFVSMAAIVLPSATMTYFIARAWTRFREAKWRKAVQAGMIPVTLALVASSAYILVATVSRGSVLLILVTIATAILTTLTKVHPLLPLAAAGALGYFGVL